MSTTGLRDVVVTGRRALPAGATISAHRHREHQLVYAARGVLAVTTDAGTWVAPATRAIWVPARMWHHHRAHGGTEVHLVGFPQDTNPLPTRRPAVLRVNPLLRELIIHYTAQPDAHTDARDRVRAVLLDQVQDAPEQPLHVPVPTDPRLLAVQAVIEADPADRRTLASLGHEVGASSRTLSRLCQAELGMTFPQWRTQMRLHRALIMLAEGHMVTAVGHRCGWSSTSTFITVFREAFGSTPGAWLVR